MPSGLPSLPVRDTHGHKGTFGTVAIFGGCSVGAVRMVGAPALAALGALRAGCGLARVYAPQPIIGEVLTIAPSATGRAIAVDDSGATQPAAARAAVDDALREALCVVIGPGMGVSAATREAACAAMQHTGITACVLDADAINALSDPASASALAAGFAGPAVITPHPGEFARLCAALGLSVSSGSDHEARAKAVAQRLRCVVVLKGHGTVITDGQRIFVNDTGNAVLATAGTGDVLSGVIAGLVAQHGPRQGFPQAGRATLDVFSLAAIAVRAHGRAADLWRAGRGATGGMLATDLLDLVPEAVQEARATA